jgi:hypothetical protein
MAERKIYSCDWCHVDAPKAGSVGDGWLVGNELDPLTSKDARVVLCHDCRGIRKQHLMHAKAEAEAKADVEPVRG